MYDNAVAKVNNIDTSTFVWKTKYGPDKSDLERKTSGADKRFLIPVNLFKKADYSAQISEIECKTPSISGLVTTSALTAVKNEILDVSGLVKKQILMQK